MQETASQGQGQAQQKPRRSAAIVGVGAALVASAVTFAIMMNSGPAPVAGQDQAATSTTRCQMMPRKLLVSTTTGSGTVRLREGSYLSPPIKIGTQPLAVVFPLPRPATTPVEEVIAIEGNANDVVITSDVTALRKVFDVVGTSAFNVTWKPMKT
jgi:hypothetical protein